MYIENDMLSKNIVDKANEIINNYLKRSNNYSVLTSYDYDPVSNIIVIVELFDYLDDKSSWLELIYKYLIIIKENLFKSEGISIGLFGGLGSLASMANYLCSKTSSFQKLAEETANEMVNFSFDYISLCEANIENLNVSHYDIISGISGITKFLQLVDQCKTKQLFEKIVQYFTSLTKSYSFKEYILPYWHVKPENLKHTGKENYQDGNLNFSMSHGIAGIIMALTIIAQKTDINIKDLLHYYVNQFEIYKYEDEQGIMYWPGYLSPDKYIQQKVEKDDVFTVSSWCYGNLSISGTLKKAASILEDVKLERQMENNIQLIYDKGFNFYFPIVCHGYAGNLLMLLNHHTEINNKKLLVEALALKVFSYYDPRLPNLFNMIEDPDSILSGAGGIVLVLISLLKQKQKSYLFDLLL